MKQSEKPSLEPRPVYVEYIAMRRCRFNPSYTAAMKLPTLHVKALISRWRERHRQAALPTLAVSLPPRKKARKSNGKGAQ